MSGPGIDQIETVMRDALNNRPHSHTVPWNEAHAALDALLEVARAAQEQAHEDPSVEWGFDGSGIHAYDQGGDPHGCPLCIALNQLNGVPRQRGTP